MGIGYLSAGNEIKEHKMDLHEVAEAMAKRVGGKSPLGGAVKFDLGGAGNIFIDGAGADNTVEVNKDSPASCTITMTAEDFGELVHGRLQPTSAFMQGKMRVDGDMGLAMKLGQMV
jgi:putative sterol carrier protein